MTNDKLKSEAGKEQKFKFPDQRQEKVFEIAVAQFAKRNANFEGKKWNGKPESERKASATKTVKDMTAQNKDVLTFLANLDKDSKERLLTKYGRPISYLLEAAENLVLSSSAEIVDQGKGDGGPKDIEEPEGKNIEKEKLLSIKERIRNKIFSLKEKITIDRNDINKIAAKDKKEIAEKIQKNIEDGFGKIEKAIEQTENIIEKIDKTDDLEKIEAQVDNYLKEIKRMRSEIEKNLELKAEQEIQTDESLSQIEPKKTPEENVELVELLDKKKKIKGDLDSRKRAFERLQDNFKAKLEKGVAEKDKAETIQELISKLKNDFEEAYQLLDQAQTSEEIDELEKQVEDNKKQYADLRGLVSDLKKIKREVENNENETEESKKEILEESEKPKKSAAAPKTETKKAGGEIIFLHSDEDKEKFQKELEKIKNSVDIEKFLKRIAKDKDGKIRAWTFDLSDLLTIVENGETKLQKYLKGERVELPKMPASLFAKIREFRVRPKEEEPKNKIVEKVVPKKPESKIDKTPKSELSEVERQQLGLIQKQLGKRYNPKIGLAIKDLIDKWNREHSTDYFYDPQKIEQAYNEVKPLVFPDQKNEDKLKEKDEEQKEKPTTFSMGKKSSGGGGRGSGGSGGGREGGGDGGDGGEREVIKAQIEKIKRVLGKDYNDEIGDEVRKRIDAWNRYDHKDHFQNDYQIREAYKQIKGEKETIKNQLEKIKKIVGDVYTEKLGNQIRERIHEHNIAKGKNFFEDEAFIREISEIILFAPQLEKIKKAVGEEYNDEMGNKVRKKIDEWNRKYSRNFFDDEEQIRAAWKLVKEEIEKEKQEKSEIEKKVAEFKNKLTACVNRDMGRLFPESFVEFSKNCLAAVEKCEREGKYEEIMKIQESFEKEWSKNMEKLYAPKEFKRSDAYKSIVDFMDTKEFKKYPAKIRGEIDAIRMLLEGGDIELLKKYLRDQLEKETRQIFSSDKKFAWVKELIEEAGGKVQQEAKNGTEVATKATADVKAPETTEISKTETAPAASLAKEKKTSFWQKAKFVLGFLTAGLIGGGGIGYGVGKYKAEEEKGQQLPKPPEKTETVKATPEELGKKFTTVTTEEGGIKVKQVEQQGKVETKKTKPTESLEKKRPSLEQFTPLDREGAIEKASKQQPSAKQKEIRPIELSKEAIKYIESKLKEWYGMGLFLEKSLNKAVYLLNSEIPEGKQATLDFYKGIEKAISLYKPNDVSQAWFVQLKKAIDDLAFAYDRVEKIEEEKIAQEAEMIRNTVTTVESMPEGANIGNWVVDYYRIKTRGGEQYFTTKDTKFLGQDGYLPVFNTEGTLVGQLSPNGIIEMKTDKLNNEVKESKLVVLYSAKDTKRQHVEEVLGSLGVYKAVGEITSTTPTKVEVGEALTGVTVSKQEGEKRERKGVEEETRRPIPLSEFSSNIDSYASQIKNAKSIEELNKIQEEVDRETQRFMAELDRREDERFAAEQEVKNIKEELQQKKRDLEILKKINSGLSDLDFVYTDKFLAKYQKEKAEEAQHKEELAIGTYKTEQAKNRKLKEREQRKYAQEGDKFFIWLEENTPSILNLAKEADGLLAHLDKSDPIYQDLSAKYKEIVDQVNAEQKSLFRLQEAVKSFENALKIAKADLEKRLANK